MPAVHSRLRGLVRGALLRCPRCGVGPLFRGFFRMHGSCPACGLSFEREPGFYLGSIYLNYGATVILTGALYALLVMAVGLTPEAALAACLATAVLFPVVFFRHARSFLLALDCSVNQGQGSAEETSGSLGEKRLAALASDDGRAGCAMGIALALILLFGLGMALATLWFTADAVVPLD